MPAAFMCNKSNGWKDGDEEQQIKKTQPKMISQYSNAKILTTNGFGKNESSTILVFLIMRRWNKKWFRSEFVKSKKKNNKNNAVTTALWHAYTVFSSLFCFTLYLKFLIHFQQYSSSQNRHWCLIIALLMQKGVKENNKLSSFIWFLQFRLFDFVWSHKLKKYIIMPKLDMLNRGEVNKKKCLAMI